MAAYIGLESRSRQGQLEGDLVNGQGYCGAIAGMIKEVQSVSEVMRSIIKTYDTVVKSLK
jgi:hypothetical protein